MGTLRGPMLYSQNKKWEVDNSFGEEIPEIERQTVLMVANPFSVNTLEG